VIFNNGITQYGGMRAFLLDTTSSSDPRLIYRTHVEDMTQNEWERVSSWVEQVLAGWKNRLGRSVTVVQVLISSWERLGWISILGHEVVCYWWIEGCPGSGRFASSGLGHIEPD
jgi:hypothetical protein